MPLCSRFEVTSSLGVNPLRRYSQNSENSPNRPQSHGPEYRTLRAAVYASVKFHAEVFYADGTRAAFLGLDNCCE